MERTSVLVDLAVPQGLRLVSLARKPQPEATWLACVGVVREGQRVGDFYSVQEAATPGEALARAVRECEAWLRQPPLLPAGATLPRVDDLF